eukprot:g1465.t1
MVRRKAAQSAVKTRLSASRTALWTGAAMIVAAIAAFVAFSGVRGPPPRAPWPLKRNQEIFNFSRFEGETRNVRFVKVLLLTLPDARGRQESVKRNLARYHLPPIEEVHAVDANMLKAGCHTVPDRAWREKGLPEGWLTFNDECLERRIKYGVDPLAADKMPHGHAALTATWVRALQRVVDMPAEALGEDDMVYIFEDDVRVQNTLVGADLRQMAGVPRDAELLDLGKGQERRQYRGFSGGSSGSDSSGATLGFFHTFGGALTHALAVSRRGAEKALRVLGPPGFYATIDVTLLSHLRGFDWHYVTRWTETAVGNAGPQRFQEIFENHGYDYNAKPRDISGYSLEPCLFTQTSYSASAQCVVHTPPQDWGSKSERHTTVQQGVQHH